MKKFPIFLSVIFSISLFTLMGAADSCSGPAKGADSAAAGKTQTHAAGEQVGYRKIEPGQKFRPDEKDDIQRFWRDDTLVRELALSPKQIDGLESAMTQYLKNLGQARQRVRKAYQRFMVALSQNAVDEETVEAAAKEFREAGSERHRLMTGRLVTLRKILDHEQWLKLRRMRPMAFQIDRFRPAVGSGTARAFIPGSKPESEKKAADPPTN